MKRLAMRRDVILIAAVVVLAVALWLLWPQSAGTQAVVVRGDEVVHTLDLRADVGRVVQVDGDYPLTVAVDEQGVYVTDAYCPDHLCERMGHRTSGMIVCLPARVRVEIRADDGIDAIAG